MAKISLKTSVIAISGDFGQTRTHSNIKRWVETNGGTFVTSLTEEVTHLICTKEHWTKKVAHVLAAEALNIKVVNYDWLEDSLLPHGKKKAEKTYFWKNVDKVNTRKKAGRKKDERRTLKAKARSFKKGCDDARNDIGSGTSITGKKSTGQVSSKSDNELMVEAFKSTANGDLWDPETPMPKKKASKRSTAISNHWTGTRRNPIVPQPVPQPVRRSREQLDAEAESRRNLNADRDWMFPENHHVYRDVHSGLEFNITLLRMDVQRNCNERYQIRLYESNEMPHTYATYVRLSRPNRLPMPEVKAFLGADFQTAFKAFMEAFKKMTGFGWEEKEKATVRPVRRRRELTASDGVGAEVPEENRPFFWANATNLNKERI